MTGLPVSRAHGATRRRITAAFTEHIWLKATAVFIAVVVWFVVNVKEPQQALVAGSPKELIKLNSNLPVIRRSISSAAPDTLVVDLRPQDVILPEGVDAVVRVVAPRSVTLRFESTWSRKVPVRSAIDVATSNGSGPGPVAMKIDRVGHIPAWLLGLIIGGPLVRSLVASFRVRNAKARAELGWAPRFARVRDALPSALAGLA